jgi:hypothetical protein
MAVTVTGGATHAMGTLSQAELQAAQSALSKLKSQGSTLGSHLSGAMQSATMASGLAHKAGGLSTTPLVHGQGSDTFIGGVRSSTLAPAPAAFGSDTVVSGSAKPLGSSRETLRSAQHISLSSDTVTAAGATAASLQAVHPEETKSATMTLADKTTIKIAGLSAHDISKLHH